MNLKITLLRLLGKKRIALASYPRSGNTWLRFMIEQATGQPSGSVYQDRILRRGAEGVVIKTHKLDSDQYTAAIHLLRNPFDAVESRFHWKAEINPEESLAWGEHILKASEQWRDHTIHWLNAACPVYRIRYEDLHQDTAGQLRALLRWLKYDLPDARIAEVVEAARIENLRSIDAEIGQKFFRRGTVGDGISSFSEEQVRFVLDLLEDVMVECGYAELVETYRQNVSTLA
jgi:hypothetical protein